MWVWICVSSRTPDEARRKASTAHFRYSAHVGAAQRQPLAQGRLVDLDDADAGRLQVGHLVAQRPGRSGRPCRAAADRRARTTIAGS